MVYRPTIIKSYTLLSAWIFVWSIIYCIAKYFVPSSSLYVFLQTFANPVFALLFALAFQTYAFFQIMMNMHRIVNLPLVLTKMFALTFVFKLLPLYLVVGIHPLNIFLNNIYRQLFTGVSFFIILFLLYFAYITQQHLDIFDIYNDLIESLINDDNRIPPYRWMISIAKYINGF